MSHCKPRAETRLRIGAIGSEIGAGGDERIDRRHYLPMLGGEGMSAETDPTEQANRCRNLLFSVVRQAVIDHRANLKTARARLNAIRKAKRLPSAEDCEVVEFALLEEPGRWLMSDDVGRMSFRWCCEHIGIDPSWIRLRMGRHEFLASMDMHEKRKAA